LSLSESLSVSLNLSLSLWFEFESENEIESEFGFELEFLCIIPVSLILVLFPPNKNTQCAFAPIRPQRSVEPPTSQTHSREESERSAYPSSADIGSLLRVLLLSRLRRSDEGGSVRQVQVSDLSE